MDRVFKGRREDQRLVTGMGRYSADWRETGELYAHFVRSDRAHADISVDVSEAHQHPGVVAVLTHADTAAAGIRFPPPRLPYPGRNGPIRSPADHGVFASTRVRYVGEEIAMVVATSALAAQDAANHAIAFGEPGIGSGTGDDDQRSRALGDAEMSLEHGRGREYADRPLAMHEEECGHP